MLQIKIKRVVDIYVNLIVPLICYNKFIKIDKSKEYTYINSNIVYIIILS